MTDSRTPTSDPVAAAWDAAPQTEAGRRLFTDNEPGDMLESDGVTWGDVVAIEAEARQQARAAFAAHVAAQTNPAYDPGIHGSSYGEGWDDAIDRVQQVLAASPEPASPDE